MIVFGPQEDLYHKGRDDKGISLASKMLDKFEIEGNFFTIIKSDSLTRKVFEKRALKT